MADVRPRDALALVTAILRTLLHGLAQTGEDPGLLLSLSPELSRHDEADGATDLFVSACFRSRYAGGDARRASAGHPSRRLATGAPGAFNPYANLKNNPALGSPRGVLPGLHHELEENDITFEMGRCRRRMSPATNHGREVGASDHANIALTSATSRRRSSMTCSSFPNLLADDLCLPCGGRLQQDGVASGVTASGERRPRSLTSQVAKARSSKIEFADKIVDARGLVSCGTFRDPQAGSFKFPTELRGLPHDVEGFVVEEFQGQGLAGTAIVLAAELPGQAPASREVFDPTLGLAAAVEPRVCHRQKGPVLGAPFRRARDRDTEHAVVILGQSVCALGEVGGTRGLKFLDRLLVVARAIERGAEGVAPIKVGGFLGGRLLGAADEFLEKRLVALVAFKSIGQNARPKQGTRLGTFNRGVVERQANILIELLPEFVVPDPSNQGQPRGRVVVAKGERLLNASSA